MEMHGTIEEPSELGQWCFASLMLRMAIMMMLTSIDSHTVEKVVTADAI